MSIDYKNYAVLYIDDELNSLKYFNKIYSSNFIIYTAENAAQGWEMLQDHSDQISVVLSDQRMPGESGVQLLKRVRENYPDMIRILVTAFADIESAVDAVNEGAIYKYISKPWDIPELRVTLMRSVDFYLIQKERNRLVLEKLSIIQRMFNANHDKNLAILGLCLDSDINNSIGAIAAFVNSIPDIKIDMSVYNEFWRDMEKLPRTESQYIYTTLKELRKIFNQSEDGTISNINAFFESIPDLMGEKLIEDINLSIDIISEIDSLDIGPKFIVHLLENLLSIFNILTNLRSEIKLTVNISKLDDANGSLTLSLNDDLFEWSDDQKLRLYSPFSAKSSMVDGAGINLLISHLIVYHLGGEMEVDANKKTKFEIKIPFGEKNIKAIQTPYRDFSNLFCNSNSWLNYLGNN